MRTLIPALCAGALGLTLGLNISTHTPPTQATQAAPTFGQPCAADDGTGPRPCYWDAGTMGNKEGRSFYVNERGELYTLAP